MQKTDAALPPEPYLPFHRPVVGDDEIEAVTRVLRSGWLTTGAETAAFEREFADFLGVDEVLALNSCTAALHLALAVLNLKPGDEVLLPTTTFAASAEVVAYFGGKPVLCDVLPTLNLDPAEIARRATPRTRAVMVVHMAGQPADLTAVRAAAARRGLPVIEDAAHSLPAWHRAQLVGSDSEIACFSFYATKNLTMGEGGAFVTRNKQWAARARSLALHGISRNAWNRYGQGGSWFYEILEPGYKYNLTDIAAAVGRVQLRRQMDFLRRREALVADYKSRLQGTPGLAWPPLDPQSRSAWHLLIALIEPGARRDRDQVIEFLRERNIGTSVHFIPLHLHPYFRDRWNYTPESLPGATRWYRQSLSLPLYPTLTEADLDRICGAVRAALGADA